MRVLDIDLDFFVNGSAHWRDAGDDRLDANDFPPWSVEDAVRFIEQQCGVTERLPGWAVEQHAEIFDRWRGAIGRRILVPPFSVTHVDAHADLGLGDAGYVYVMTELLFQSVEKRTNPRRHDSGLADGNWLMFALACQWISDLTYVFNEEEGRPVDLMAPVMEGFDTNADHIQLAAMLNEDMRGFWFDDPCPRIQHIEPKVPFVWVAWPDFSTTEPYDFVCLARSPEFTPAEADAIYDTIRERFIDELIP